MHTEVIKDSVVRSYAKYRALAIAKGVGTGTLISFATFAIIAGIILLRGHLAAQSLHQSIFIIRHMLPYFSIAELVNCPIGTCFFWHKQNRESDAALPVIFTSINDDPVPPENIHLADRLASLLGSIKTSAASSTECIAPPSPLCTMV